MGDDNMDSKQFAWSSVMGSYGGEYNFVNSPTATQSQTPGADDLNDSQVSSMAEAAMAAAAMAAAAAASRNGAGAGGGGESESGLVLPLKRKYEEIDSPTSSSTSSSSPLSGYPMQSIPFNTLGNYGTSFGFSSGGPFLPSGQALSRPGQGQMEYQNYLSQAQMSHASNQPQRYQYYSNSPSDEALQPPTKRHASSLSTTSPSGYDTSMAPPPSPPPGLSNSGSSVSSGATSPSSMAAAAAAAAILARNKQTNYWDKIEEIARANYECSTIEEHRGKSLVQLQRSQANSELLTILNIDETWQYFALNQDVDWSRLTDKERQTKINNIRKSVLRALQKKNFQTIQHSAYGKGSYSIFRRTLPPPLPDSALQSSSSSSSSSSALPSLSHPHAGSDAFSFDTPSITSSMFDVNAMQSLFSMQSVRISNLEHTLQDRQLADISACDLVALLLPSVNQIKIGQNKIFQQLSSISSLVSKIRTSLHSPTGLVAVPVIESTDPATLYIENLPQGITMRLNNEVALWGCPNLQLQLWIERSVSVSSDGFSPNVHSSSSSNPFVFPCSLDYLDNNQAVIVHNANWNSLEVSEGDTVCLLLRYYNVATNTFRIPVVSSSSSRSHSDLISQISCAYLP